MFNHKTDYVLKNHLSHLLDGKRILLGISGGIAAFKSIDIIRLLNECGAITQVALTENALNFVTPLTLETVSKNKVLNSLWKSDAVGTHHISTARSADLFLIYPATANIIAKLANGIADDLITTEALAFQGPKLIAPTMNPTMFENPATRRNIEQLKSDGWLILGPESGLTSCGEEGLGRAIEPSDVIISLASCFYSKSLNKKCLITLGPTQCDLDPVRYISNKSSGLMGLSLILSALAQGYEVEAISGVTSDSLGISNLFLKHQKLKFYYAPTVSLMFKEVQRLWKNSDIFIGNAAVLDWEVEEYSKEKIKKTSENSMQVKFKKSPDILKWVSENRTGSQFVLGFAAETQNTNQNALEKIKTKNCDAIFANTVSNPETAFGSSKNKGTLFFKTNQTPIQFDLNTKYKIALDLITELSKFNFHKNQLLNPVRSELTL